MSRRPPMWAVWALGAAVVVFVMMFFPVGTPPRSAIYNAVPALTLPLILYGIHRNRPARPAAWFLVAGWLVMNLAGGVIYAYQLIVDHSDAFPSVADYFFVGAYPVGVLAVLVMVRAQSAGGDRAGLIDASVITTGLALVSWTFLIRPIVLDGGSDVTSRVISAGYPVGDVLILAVLARLFFGPGARTPAFWLLAASMTLTLAGDVGYSVSQIVVVDDYPWDSPFWAVGYALLGVAALHPSMRSLTLPAPVPETAAAIGRGRLVLLAGTSLIAPALLARNGLTDPAHVDWAGITAGSAVLFLLVVTRVAMLVDQVRAQSAQLHVIAHRDALTGVPNRRSWDLNLTRTLTWAARQGCPAHVAILDLDRFKAYNDQYGHQAGDQLLKAAAAAWTDQLRDDDLLARYGGEEFGLLLTGVPVGTAEAIIARLRAATPGGQSFSAGLATWDGTESATHLVERADQALYRAKRDGRSRTAMAAATLSD